MNVMRASCVVLLCLVLPVAIGCDKGPKLVKVGGTVTYKNAPVSGATVTFVWPDKDISVGSTDENGKFTLTTGGRPGSPVGEARVSVSKVKTGYSNTKPYEQLRPQEMAKGASEKGTGMKTTAESTTNELPEKYQNPETTDLKATVPPEGVEDLEFNLVD